MEPGTFDFGLTAEQEARADRLHRAAIIIDFLSQGPGGNILAAYSDELRSELAARMAAAGSDWERLSIAGDWPYEQVRNGTSELVREWYVQSGLTCGGHGVPVHDGHNPVWKAYDEPDAQSELPWVRRVTTADEIRAAKRDGALALYGGWQPVDPAPRDLGAFDAAYERGLRSFMLTYNLMDNIGVGCTERVDAGLSTFGVSVVQHLNELGVIVDTSHCGHLTTLDACRHSKQPVTANHTTAKAVYAHARGKSDEAIRAIADTGGFVGVLAVPFFLSGERSPTIEHLLDHVDHIVGLVGWEHVAIGTDWPMTAPDDLLLTLLSPANTNLGFRDEDNLQVTERLVGFDDIRDFPNITRGLVKRGYPDEAIRGILGENGLRVFAEVCG
jgi:membrane dipeptidase